MGEEEDAGLSIWDVLSKSQLVVMLRAAEERMFVPDYSSMSRDDLAAAMRERFSIEGDTLRVKEEVNGLFIGDLMYKPRMPQEQRRRLGKSARRLLRGKPTRAHATSAQLFGNQRRKREAEHSESAYVASSGDRCDVGYTRFMGRCVRRTRHGPVPRGLCGDSDKYVRGPDGKCYDLLTEKAVEVSPEEIERRREKRRAILAERLGRARAMRSSGSSSLSSPSSGASSVGSLSSPSSGASSSSASSASSGSSASSFGSPPFSLSDAHRSASSGAASATTF